MFTTTISPSREPRDAEYCSLAAAPTRCSAASSDDGARPQRNAPTCPALHCVLTASLRDAPHPLGLCAARACSPQMGQIYASAIGTTSARPCCSSRTPLAITVGDHHSHCHTHQDAAIIAQGLSPSSSPISKSRKKPGGDAPLRYRLWGTGSRVSFGSLPLASLSATSLRDEDSVFWRLSGDDQCRDETQ